jgi:hypothetical protein
VDGGATVTLDTRDVLLPSHRRLHRHRVAPIVTFASAFVPARSHDGSGGVSPLGNSRQLSIAQPIRGGGGRGGSGGASSLVSERQLDTTPPSAPLPIVHEQPGDPNASRSTASLSNMFPARFRTVSSRMAGDLAAAVDLKLKRWPGGGGVSTTKTPTASWGLSRLRRALEIESSAVSAGAALNDIAAAAAAAATAAAVVAAAATNTSTAAVAESGNDADADIASGVQILYPPCTPAPAATVAAVAALATSTDDSHWTAVASSARHSQSAAAAAVTEVAVRAVLLAGEDRVRVGEPAVAAALAAHASRMVSSVVRSLSRAPRRGVIVNQRLSGGRGGGVGKWQEEEEEELAATLAYLLLPLRRLHARAAAAAAVASRADAATGATGSCGSTVPSPFHPPVADARPLSSPAEAAALLPSPSRISVSQSVVFYQQRKQDQLPDPSSAMTSRQPSLIGRDTLRWQPSSNENPPSLPTPVSPLPPPPLIASSGLTRQLGIAAVRSDARAAFLRALGKGDSRQAAYALHHVGEDAAAALSSTVRLHIVNPEP